MSKRVRTPRQAFDRFIGPLDYALSCITQERLYCRDWHPTATMRVHLGRQNDPARLNSDQDIWLSAGMQFRLYKPNNIQEHGRFRVQTVSYWYAFATQVNDDQPEGIPFLTFHWTPEATERNARTYPHLHIEPGLISNDWPLLRDRFHELHVPTHRLSIEEIVLFAIDELGVTSLRGSDGEPWRERLLRNQATFELYRRSGN